MLQGSSELGRPWTEAAYAALPRQGTAGSFDLRAPGELSICPNVSLELTPPHTDEILNKCGANTEHKALIFFKLLAFTVNSI